MRLGTVGAGGTAAGVAASTEGGGGAGVGVGVGVAGVVAAKPSLGPTSLSSQAAK